MPTGTIVDVRSHWLMGSYIAAVGFGCDLPDASEEGVASADDTGYRIK